MELEKLFEVKMIKILIVGLMLIDSGNVYSSEKEYTIKSCISLGREKDDCQLCEEVGKVSFKVSKSLSSVMETKTIFHNGKIISNVIDNCKIFDDDTFECKTISEWEVKNSHLKEILILSNGKWESYQTIHGKKFSKRCGTEIKSDFNLFK